MCPNFTAEQPVKLLNKDDNFVPAAVSSPNIREYNKIISELRNITQAVKLGDRGPGVLSERGYGSLAVCATFLAGMQAQVLSLVLGNGGVQFPAVSALFLVGLMANIFGALLSFEAARWFEMLTEEEAEFCMSIQDGRCSNADAFFEKGNGRGSLQSRDAHPNHRSYGLVDPWIAVAIAAGPYLVVLGMGSFIIGVVLYTFQTQGLAIQVILTAFCVACVALFPPFGLRHNRFRVLNRLHLERRSDVGYIRRNQPRYGRPSPSPDRL